MMRTAKIPNTELSPSVLCLGTVNLGATIDRETSFTILDAFFEHGGTFIDTAKIYSDWIPGEKSRSEKVIGEWMRERKNRERVILATKGAHPELSSMHTSRLSKQEITADLEASLRHLQVDYIDLYWLHRDDPARPIAEILETLASLVRFGKIRYYGCSNWHLERIQEAQAYAVENGMAGFSGIQNLWNLAKVNTESLADPTLVVMDQPLWNFHRKTQLAAIPFSSQANGLFQKLESGQVERISEGQRRMFLNPETEKRFRGVQALKAQTGLTTSQIVLGYLTGQPFPTFPIIGPQNMEQLEDSLRAADLRLTQEQIRFLVGDVM